MDLWETAARQFEPQPRRFATPGALAQHCDPTTRQTKPLDLIDQAVVNVFDGVVTKQQIHAPPQTGKSQRVSRWTPLWMLTCDPSLRIAIVSFELDTAVRWGRQIKRDVEDHPELGIVLEGDSKAAGRWETDQGGGVYCVGIRGSLTGRPIDYLLIDDPIKDRAAAESKTIRDAGWDFWENVAKVRARHTILIETRWHTDELAGRLLDREPGEWAVLAMPAIAESPDDPLGREIGEEIESANRLLHQPGWFHQIQKTTSPYVWSSLYQQRPTAAEGGIFKRGDWRFWEPYDDSGRSMLRLDDHGGHDLETCARFITLDLATSTKTSADFTVAAAWAITLGGDLILLDMVRDRVPEIDHAAFLAPLRQRWLGRYDVTHVESRMFGTTLVYALGRANVPVAELHADTDKLTRALPYAGLVRQHRVWLPRTAPWLDGWLDEHADFPTGKHDDQVDVGAYAARVVIAHWTSPADDDLPSNLRDQDPDLPDDDPMNLDLMTARF